jgi:c-di-GMP-binding flagellar brake protein YcgR
MQLKTIDDKEARKEYKSRIADMNDEELAIEIPLSEETGRLKRFKPRDELSAYYLNEEGSKFYFDTTVIGYQEDTIPLIRIRKPHLDEISRIQRRSFLRVTADLELSIQHAEGHYQLVRTEDIGGGGISFVVEPTSSTGIEMGKTFACWLLLLSRSGKPDHVFFKAEVIRLVREDNRLLCMMRFNEIADKERQKIIRYCFERQIDFRKN